MGPIDYTSAFAGITSPYDGVMQGMKDGLAIRQLQQQREQAEAAAQAKAQMQADLASLSQNPTTQAITAMSLKYPQLSEQFKRSYDMLEPQEQKARLEQALPVYTALHKNQPEIARKTLLEQAEAYRNTGKEREARAAEAQAKAIEDNPAAAKINMGGLLAAVVGPDKWTKIVGDMGAEERAEQLAPSALRKAEADASGAQADAQTKGVTAKYAEKNAVADLETKGWNIKALQGDIEYKRNQTQIGYLNAKIARENNELQRQKLQVELDKAVTERDEKLRGKVADVESAVGNIDNMLNTIARIRNNSSLNSVLGSLEGKDFYPNTLLGTANPFGDGDERADAIRLIDTLGSQAFLAQIPNIKGMGALSNAEGAKLEAAFQNLSRNQSEKQFRETLQEATRLLEKGRNTVSKRYGVPIGNPDTPAASGGRPPLSSFQR